MKLLLIRIKQAYPSQSTTLTLVKEFHYYREGIKEIELEEPSLMKLEKKYGVTDDTGAVLVRKLK